MQTVFDFLQNFTKIDLNQQVEFAMLDNQPLLVNQQKTQMFAGLRGDGEEINPLHGRYIGYADFTREKKQKEGKIWQWVTLKDKGDFYNGIFIDVRSDVFVLDSTDSKTESLIAYYGPEIFGFNDNSREDINEPLNQTLIDNIEKELQ